MKFFSQWIVFSATVFANQFVGADVVDVMTADGGAIALEIQHEDTFIEVIDKLVDNVSQTEECNQWAQGQVFLVSKDDDSQIRYAVNIVQIRDALFSPKASRHQPAGVRNYNTKLAEGEKSDIRYIVTTLGNVSIPNLIFYKSSLEQAGDRIDHVHPLRFLEYVFTNEELKVGIRNVKSKGSWVWGDFLGGLSNSLNEESDYSNMTDTFIRDFAANVKVDVNAIYNLIKQRQWGLLIETLISKIPREGDTKRYNM